jgi:hypothetical protein
MNVTAEDLRRLITVEPRSLFRDADTLVVSDDGVVTVPFRVVSATLSGETRFVHRVLTTRAELAEVGVVSGRHPRTNDGSDLDERLAELARGLTDDLNEPADKQPGQ